MFNSYLKLRIKEANHFHHVAILLVHIAQSRQYENKSPLKSD